jgi:hypothetical protein
MAALSAERAGNDHVDHEGGPAGGSLITMRCIGQSVGSEAELRAQSPGGARGAILATDGQIARLPRRGEAFCRAARLRIRLHEGEVRLRARSLDAGAIEAMLAAVAAIPAGGLVLLCDSYDGKISDVAADATAFPRRDGTQYCIQYYSSWTRAADTPTHVAQVTKVYAAMRPFMPGASYVNYCDLDCRTIPTPIGADNLTRLMAVKQQYDPQNLFHQSQSVPPPQA